jgi:hypothetical protein
MQMVGHDLERILDQRPEPPRQGVPSLLHKPPRLVQKHLAFDDFAEQTLLGLGTDGDEIRTAPGVIIPAQTNGPSMM